MLKIFYGVSLYDFKVEVETEDLAFEVQFLISSLRHP